VIGDWGDPTRNVKRVAATMASRASALKPEFVITVGDNFYWSGVSSTRDPQFKTKWKDVFLRHKALRIPWQVCLGNHDYDGNAQAQIAFTTCSRNPRGLWQCPAANYSFSRSLPGGGTVDFSVLDTVACQYDDINRVWCLRDHVRRLHDNFFTSKATWKLVFGHHPMYNKGERHSTEGHLLREGCGLEKALVESGAHAYFSGHEHIFQHHHCQGIGHYGCGASGAAYLGLMGSKRGGCKLPGWLDKKARAGYVEVALTATSMQVSFIGADGSTLKTIQQTRDSAVAAVAPAKLGDVDEAATQAVAAVVSAKLCDCDESATSQTEVLQPVLSTEGVV